MDAFDYLIMTVGGALIVVGLYLYISGKKDGGSTNNLEGFGIKLNVSNPSILLIMVGVLLLLVPRFFPKASSPIKTIPTVKNTTEPKIIEELSYQEQERDTGETKEVPALEPSTKQRQTPPIQRAFLPSGVWQLSSYSENGIDLSANIMGTMNFISQSAQSVNWSSSFVSTDIWGNMYNYNYQGITSSNGNTYTLSITASNESSFIRQAPVPLELTLEDGGILHMRYVYLGNEILLHWQR